MGKDGPRSPSTPTLLFYWGQPGQATPDGVLVLDIALEKLQQMKAVMSGFCCASLSLPSAVPRVGRC